MLGASTRLVMEICNRWSIAIDRDHVIGHREIYARKTCPGTWIDLDDYVTRARRLALDPASYNFVGATGERAGAARSQLASGRADHAGADRAHGAGRIHARVCRLDEQRADRERQRPLVSEHHRGVLLGRGGHGPRSTLATLARDTVT